MEKIVATFCICFFEPHDFAAHFFILFNCHGHFFGPKSVFSFSLTHKLFMSFHEQFVGLLEAGTSRNRVKIRYSHLFSLTRV